MRKPTPEEVKNDMAHLRAIEEILRAFDNGEIDHAEAVKRREAADRLYTGVKNFVTEIDPV